MMDWKSGYENWWQRVNPVFVYVTCGSQAEAEKIGHALVEAELAACANIVPGMQSIYRWQGRIETAQETILILKSRQELFTPLAAKIRALHSYATPCIVALPIVAGEAGFLEWIKDNTLGDAAYVPKA